MINKIAKSGDTYHNRFAPDRKHNKGDKKFAPLKKVCSKCKTTSGQLDIHHKDGNRKNNNRSNLTYMCRSCHRSKHDGAGNIESIISSAARIINDPNTEKTQEIAKAHANSDLMHVEFILCHNNVNKNRDHFNSDDMKANAHTAINKPINWEHSTKNIGVIYSSKFVGIEDIDEDSKAYYGKVDPLEKDFIVCQAAIWEYKHPEEAGVMRSRNDSELLFFSMENKFGSAQCSECNEVYSSVYEYCDHLLSRRSTESKAYRSFVDSNYVGAGVVGRPADVDSKTLALAEDELEATICAFAGVINPQDYIEYLRGDVKMRSGIEIPEECHAEGDALDKQFYADDENKHFPIDCADNILASANLIANDEEAVANYEPKELIYMLERISKAAIDYNVDLKEVMKGGVDIVNKQDITQSNEFKEAFKVALAEEVEKMKNGEALKELEAKISKATDSIDELEQTAKAEKQKTSDAEDKIAQAEQELEDYKLSVAAEKVAEDRMSELEDGGFAFSEESRPIVFSCAFSLSDEHFSNFTNLLTEIKESAIAAHGEKKEKEKEDEDKKKKEKDTNFFEKKKKKDVVAESKDEENKAVASVEHSSEDSFASEIDNVFSGLKKREFSYLYADKEGK